MAKKIKIAYIISDLGLGGAQTLLFDTIRFLKFHNCFDIYVITINSGAFIGKFENSGIRVLDVKEHKLLSVRLYFKLKKFLEEIHPDIVHTHCSKADFYGRIAARRLKTKVIFTTYHNYSSHHKGADINKRSLFDLIDNLVVKYSGTFLIAVSDVVKQYLINRNKKFENITEVICNGSDISKENYLLDSETKMKEFKAEIELERDDFVISILGRIEKQKGYIFFLDAVKNFLHNNSTVKVLIIGDGSLQKKTAEYIKFNSLDASVKLTGFKPDVEKYLEISDLICVPSLWEAFGLVIIEAMIKKKLVLASNTGGIPEIITDSITGFLFQSQNKNSLIEKLSFIYKNILNLNQVKENAFQKVKEKYNIEKNSELYYQAYIKKLSKL